MQEQAKHVAIIMDGNGRWAQKRYLPRNMGHRAGVQVVESIIKASIEQRVEALTLYSLSQENLNRPQSEIAFLYQLIADTLSRQCDKLMKAGIQLNWLGDLSILPEYLQDSLLACGRKTAQNNKLILNLAINYSGQWHILKACQQCCKKQSNTAITRQDLDAALAIPGGVPDLLIRSGGEQRLSNFLLWHFAYTELLFLPQYWPDFTVQDFLKALQDFSTRTRRFGHTDQQLDYLA